MNFDFDIVDVKLVASADKGVQGTPAFLKASVTSPLNSIDTVINDAQVDE